ncbi:hypothetical protein JT358_05360 [Micrococcales bacterium 31B]|nr:hypothetical protein [Micrococcales bacterium 31B]
MPRHTATSTLFALDRLHRSSADGSLRTSRGEKFDVTGYSAMKYGARSELAARGAALGAALLDKAPALRTDPAAPLFPVAYLRVPPACYYLAEYAAHTVNAARRAIDPALPAAHLVRIAKSDVVALDYASATADERSASLQSLTFTLAEDVTGHAVVLVDDARITGHAERTAIDCVLAAGEPTRVIGACLVEVDAALRAEPTVEAELNHALITRAVDMLPWIDRGDFVLTIRWLKNFLAQSDEFASALPQVPTDLLRAIVDGARGSGRGVTAAYATAIEALTREVERRDA